MFCVRCGGELLPGALFCAKCGASVAGVGEAVSASSPSPVVSSPFRGEASKGTESQNVDLRDAVKQTTKRSHRLPIVVLIALAMILGVGVAYAAYRVYADIIQPWQESVQQQGAVSQGDDSTESLLAESDVEKQSELPSGLEDGWWCTVSSINTYHHFHDGIDDVFLSESDGGLFVPYSHEPDYTYSFVAEHTDAPGVFEFGSGYLISLRRDSSVASSKYFIPDDNPTIAWCIWQDEGGGWLMSVSDSIGLGERPEQLRSY